jgi:translation initiation factor eIF-2B subunit epsilon
MIGSSTSVAEDTEITSSVVGRDCRIGAKSRIRDSYVFDGAEIGANCVLEQCIVGYNAHIKDGSTISPGCLIGDGVIVGPNAKLEPFERLSKRRGTPSEAANESDRDDEDDEDSELEDLEASAFAWLMAHAS